jgi:hypothetical protein
VEKCAVPPIICLPSPYALVRTRGYAALERATDGEVVQSSSDAIAREDWPKFASRAELVLLSEVSIATAPRGENYSPQHRREEGIARLRTSLYGALATWGLGPGGAGDGGGRQSPSRCLFTTADLNHTLSVCGIGVSIFPGRMRKVTTGKCERKVEVEKR